MGSEALIVGMQYGKCSSEPVYSMNLWMNASSFYSVDPFSKKDWYDVKAPAMFNIRNLGKTLVTRTQGTSKFT